MILKASQRGGGAQLARHLMNDVDNDHIELHELRGFAANSLHGAFKEAYAVSRGTRCRQFLFSVSLSPPETEQVAVGVFETAIDEIERRVGLSGHAHAIVFHEKEGRRHAHAVWSRIDAGRMRAINLPHFKFGLRDLSRQLYLENGWQMPRGLIHSEERDPLNFTLAEWQQARRAEVDPRQIKVMLQGCWAISDSRKAFAGALAERGYALARGDRRGHVVVDWRGNFYAVSRWVGIKAREVGAKLGEPDDLPTVAEVRFRLARQFSAKLRAFVAEETTGHDKALAALRDRKNNLVARHRVDREELRERHATRQNSEIAERAFRLPRGVKAVWWKITGQWKDAIRQIDGELPAGEDRDRRERQVLIDRQLSERRHLLEEFKQFRDSQSLTREALDRDIAAYLAMSHDAQSQAIDTRSLQT